MFAGCLCGDPGGSTVYILCLLGAAHALAPNFRRILGWLCVSAVFWIAGGRARRGRIARGLWAGRGRLRILSPMIGFRFPGLGRSRTSDWTIEGGHLAERSQLFVIVALGESILVTGATWRRAGGMP